MRAPIASSLVSSPIAISLSIRAFAPSKVRFTSPFGRGKPPNVCRSSLSKVNDPLPPSLAPAASTVRLLSVSAFNSPGTSPVASSAAICSGSNRFMKGVTFPVRSSAMVAGSRGSAAPGSKMFHRRSDISKPPRVRPKAMSCGSSASAIGAVMRKALSAMLTSTGNGSSGPDRLKACSVARTS